MQQIRDNLEHKCTGERFILNAARNFELGSDDINPTRIPRKGDTYNIVIDSRLFNAITDLSQNQFPSLPVQVLIPPISGETFSQTDLFTTYH